eukprot:CAMPEP_0195653254 /NCGR_PEP_ID=MMETSP0815-20121206/33298_1 /TAXON_ID=97485 /ORGANISM="Prymnesium parvum, Strain Texoma1" /LENGTH=42 /DNA_ID= /DNA_START= /DNA_END= /DNA_ORIENTATION=
MPKLHPSLRPREQIAKVVEPELVERRGVCLELELAEQLVYRG